MRSSRNAVALVLALALLAACGGSDGDAAAPEDSASATASPSGDAKPAKKKAAKTAAPSARTKPSAAGKPTSTPARTVAPQTMALANAGALAGPDMPGYVNEPQYPGAAEAKVEKDMYSCLGAKQPVYLARQPGRYWTKGPEQVLSSADVMKSAEAAQADLEAAKAAGAPDCFAGPVMARYGGDGTRTTAVGKAVPVVVKGATDAVAFKIVVTVKGTQDPQKFVAYVVQAVVGSVRVSILLAHTNGTEPALATAIRLARLAAARVVIAEKS